MRGQGRQIETSKPQTSSLREISRIKLQTRRARQIWIGKLKIDALMVPWSLEFAVWSFQRQCRNFNIVCTNQGLTLGRVMLQEESMVIGGASVVQLHRYGLALRPAGLRRASICEFEFCLGSAKLRTIKA